MPVTWKELSPDDPIFTIVFFAFGNAVTNRRRVLRRSRALRCLRRPRLRRASRLLPRDQNAKPAPVLASVEKEGRAGGMQCQS